MKIDQQLLKMIAGAAVVAVLVIAVSFGVGMIRSRFVLATSGLIVIVQRSESTSFQRSCTSSFRRIPVERNVSQIARYGAGEFWRSAVTSSTASALRVLGGALVKPPRCFNGVSAIIPCFAAHKNIHLHPDRIMLTVRALCSLRSCALTRSASARRISETRLHRNRGSAESSAYLARGSFRACSPSQSTTETRLAAG